MANDKEQLVIDTEIDNGKRIKFVTSLENEDVYFEDEYEDEVVNE